MTNTFKNASADPVPTSATTIYTCPSGTSAIVHNIHLAATDASLPVTATVTLYDSSATADRTLAKNLPISVGGAIDFNKPINLEVGDQIKITASASNRLSAVLSILEIS